MGTTTIATAGFICFTPEELQTDYNRLVSLSNGAADCKGEDQRMDNLDRALNELVATAYQREAERLREKLASKGVIIARGAYLLDLIESHA